MAVSDLRVGRSSGAAPQVSNIGRYQSYFSGTDIRIYFGDVWVDEIVELGFSMNEQVAPIYGFASHTWDKVARGNRIVQGQFTINFKEVGYLHTILDRLAYQVSQGNPGAPFELVDNHAVMRANNRTQSIEQLLNNFQSLADKYEDSIWGQRTDFARLTDNRQDDTFFYGVNSNENKQYLRDHGFNILLTYGGACDMARGSTGFRTAQSIVNVQLTGVSQVVDPSGNPIQEVYSFIAKDISGNIQKLH